MSPLIVIDPALGRTGVHNLVFAEILAGQEGKEPLGIFGNAAMDAGLRHRLASRYDLVEAVFDLDFYALAGKSGGVGKHWDWIYGLVSTYVGVFERVLARWPGRPLRLLHHTLSWEHANALALAIRSLGPHGACLQHIVLSMQSPGVDDAGQTLDPEKRLNFRIAFGALHDTGQVDLYACCRDYAEAYRYLLGLPGPMPLHPCIVGDWSHPRTSLPGRKEQRVLMYLGEVNQDKGFLDLPRRLRQELAVSGPARHFVLQFTEARTEEKQAIIRELRALAEKHKNVHIHEGPWAEATLAEALASASVLRLDYEPEVYRHKISGLLWLAAWYRLAVTVPPGSWLEREARRLGVAVIPADKPAIAANARIDHRKEDLAYFQTLFTPFRDWLAGLPAPVDVQTPATRARASRPEPAPMGQGAAVVLFWKQNDSTLYGRRSDMVARYLASRPDVSRVLVVDAPIGEGRLATLAASTDPLRHDRWIAERTHEKLAGRHDSGKLAYTVFVHPSEGYGPDEQDRPSQAFLKAYEAFLRAEFAHWGIDPARALFWIYPRNFSLPPLLPRFSPARVVVDVVDDHRAWPGLDEAEKARLGAHYRELLARADLALANCEPVREAMSALGRSPVLVPNGSDMPLPVHVDNVDEALREHLTFTGPTLGFVGNLEAKIDIALLSRLAEDFPDCRLVLIGSTHANPEVLSLRRHPNVRLAGVVPYDRLGAWLSRFDVGLIPHRQMELTRYMNPLKAYVYLANGVPVVATAVPNVEPVPGLLTLAPDPEAFVAAVATCLLAGRPARDRFEAVSATHSWAARLGSHLDALHLASIGKESA